MKLSPAVQNPNWRGNIFLCSGSAEKKIRMKLSKLCNMAFILYIQYKKLRFRNIISVPKTGIRMSITYQLD
jgi:hypothetical protein